MRGKEQTKAEAFLLSVPGKSEVEYPMRRLILFDIDCTLLKAGGAGRRAMRKALAEHLGDGEYIDRVKYDGKTDPLIVRESHEASLTKEPLSQELQERILSAYLLYLEENLRSETGATLMPGILPLLESLRREREVTLGLLTGNMERGGRLKLGLFHLNGFFPFGAFGSDHWNRNLLLPIAWERAERSTGHSFSPRETVIVGDSIHDVACVKPYGAKVLAVATGSTPSGALLAGDPDGLMESLEMTDKAVEVLLTL